MFASQSVLFAIVATISSFVVVNGAVVQRDGTFTFITPQPTSPFQGAPSTTTTSSSSQSHSTTSTQTTTSSTVAPTSTASSQSSTPTTFPTATTSSSASVVASPTTSTTPFTTTSSSATVVVTPTTSTTPCSTSCVSVVASSPTSSTTPYTTTSSSATVVVPPTTSTTLCTTSSVPVVTPCTKCTPSATSTPPTFTGTANCTGVQKWQASFAYTAGNQVIFNDQLFTARQWTFNNEPPAHPDQWTAGGTCAQPINNKVNCAGFAAWQSNVPYTAGNEVTFNNRLWSAVQWTQSNPPGDTSGSWKDLGTCA